MSEKKSAKFASNPLFVERALVSRLVGSTLYLEREGKRDFSHTRLDLILAQSFAHQQHGTHVMHKYGRNVSEGKFGLAYRETGRGPNFGSRGDLQCKHDKR